MEQNSLKFKLRCELKLFPSSQSKNKVWKHSKPELMFEDKCWVIRDFLHRGIWNKATLDTFLEQTTINYRHESHGREISRTKTGKRGTSNFRVPNTQTRYSLDRYSGLITGFEDRENFPWEEQLVLLFFGKQIGCQLLKGAFSKKRAGSLSQFSTINPAKS